jgi:uncharacterized protein YbjT (DUF2867 family)
MTELQQRTALIAGATGLVGNELLHLLLAAPHYVKVQALVRRPLSAKELPLQHDKLEQIVVPNLGQTAQYAPRLRAHDVFCCLGTTMKQAGSKTAFRLVDYDYPTQIAGAALAAGAKQLLIVTALGSSKTSPIFYSRVKGEVEDAVCTLGYGSVSVVRPSFLLGHRKEQRMGEKIGIAVAGLLSPLLVGPLKKYRGIEAAAVARAMLYLATHPVPGNCFYDSDQLQALAIKTD